MDFYLLNLRFFTDLAVNTKSCVNSNHLHSALSDIFRHIYSIPNISGKNNLNIYFSFIFAHDIICEWGCGHTKCARKESIHIYKENWLYAD